MPLKVILVRHGKAETPSADVDDACRSLTTSGVAALESFLPRVLSRVDLPGGTECWTSLAVRAAQTASIVTRSCGCEITVRNQFLYEQDLDEFVRALAETDLGCVIAVGHVPCLENACERLCGERPVFGAGAVCAIDIPDAARPHIRHATRPVGHLAWFVQGPEVTA